MSKKNMTIVYVVDFSSKNVLLREELNNNSTSKKELEKREKVDSAISCLTTEMLEKQKKAS